MPIPTTTSSLFGVSALSSALTFVADLKTAKDTNDYLNKLQKAQAKAAAEKAAADVESLASRGVQTRKAAAARADEVRRLARAGIASARVASDAAGQVGSTASDAELDFRARLSETVANERLNLQGEEEQIQRLLDAVPITQENAVEQQSGVPGPNPFAFGAGILGSYLQIKAKFGT